MSLICDLSPLRLIPRFVYVIWGPSKSPVVAIRADETYGLTHGMGVSVR